MYDPIPRVFEALLRLVLPSRGRHRAAGDGRSAGCPEAPVALGSTVWSCSVSGPLDGDTVAMVRPYVVAHERQQEVRRLRRCAERRLRRRRRRALWLAVHGIDVGPRRIHGVRVAA